DRQKGRLKKKAQSNREKIESSWSKNSGAQSGRGAHDRREKTDCRNDEKIAIHSKQIYCKSRLPAWQSVFSSVQLRIRDDIFAIHKSQMPPLQFCRGYKERAVSND